MGIIADVLNLLRPPVAPEDDVIPPPTVADFRAALDRMVMEESEARQLIAAAPQRRTELLLQENSDSAIRRLEQAVDRAHLQIERLAALRPELHQRIQALQAATRADAWLDMRTRLVEQLAACALTQAAADHAAGTLRAIWLAAMNSGFRTEVDMIPHSLHGVPAGSFVDMAKGMARVKAFTPPPAGLTWNIRFLDWTAVVINPRAGPVGFQAGQEAGFDAPTARLLIEQGKAELADPKPLPPAPPKRAERKMTRVEQIRLAELQAGGHPVTAPPAADALPPPEHPRTWIPIDQLPGGL